MDTRTPSYRERRLAVAYRDLGELKPPKRSARRHTPKKIARLAGCIERLGIACPIVIDENDVILSGNALYQAAAMSGYREVATVRIDDLTEADKRALMLAMNRLAEEAEWDKAVLREEFEFLVDEDFSLDDLGFDGAFVDDVFAIGGGSEEAPVELPDPDEPAISRPGDLWILGERHRLLCADARDSAGYERLLAGERAQMAITDAPYNVAVAGHVSGLGKKVHREFAMASGEMSQAEFTSFLSQAMSQMASVSEPGSIHYHFMDFRHMGEILAAGDAVYSELKQLCIWNKGSGGMGSFYRSQHELVFVFKVGKAPHINNFGLGEKGRYRTNVWDYPGVNAFRKGRMDDLQDHPTVKPVQLYFDAMLDCSRRGGIVLDVFAGSGPIFLAAERAGRRGFGIELDPQYVDVCIRRYRKETGKQVFHEDGRTFDEVAAERLAAKKEAA